MNIKHEELNSNQLKSELSVFPNPPNHYKDFINGPNSLNPPDIQIISKITNFTTFGTEYKINQYNFHTFDFGCDTSILDKKLIKDKSIQNVELFNNKIEDIKEKISQMNIVEQINIIKAEVKFLNNIFVDLSKKFRFDIVNSETDNKLMKFSFQKIYFVISILKRKQIFAETMKYFKNEIDQVRKLEKNLNENMNLAYCNLKEGLDEINNDTIMN